MASETKAGRAAEECGDFLSIGEGARSISEWTAAGRVYVCPFAAFYGDGERCAAEHGCAACGAVA